MENNEPVTVSTRGGCAYTVLFWCLGSVVAIISAALWWIAEPWYFAYVDEYFDVTPLHPFFRAIHFIQPIISVALVGLCYWSIASFQKTKGQNSIRPLVPLFILLMFDLALLIAHGLQRLPYAIYENP